MPSRELPRKKKIYSGEKVTSAVALWFSCSGPVTGRWALGVRRVLFINLFTLAQMANAVQVHTVIVQISKVATPGQAVMLCLGVGEALGDIKDGSL